MKYIEIAISLICLGILLWGFLIALVFILSFILPSRIEFVEKVEKIEYSELEGEVTESGFTPGTTIFFKIQP